MSEESQFLEISIPTRSRREIGAVAGPHLSDRNASTTAVPAETGWLVTANSCPVDRTGILSGGDAEWLELPPAHPFADPSS